MTITLSENVAPSTIARILTYLKGEKVPFTVNEPNDEDADAEHRTAAIRERLREKSRPE